jgi:hypothetical protein
MHITVRAAAPTDIDWLVTQLRSFSAYFGTKRSLFGDEEFAKDGMRRMMDEHFMRVSERDDGVLTGFISGIITPHLFNPSIRVLTETFWWVAEPFRKTRSSVLLLNSFLSWGEANADWIAFGLEAQTPVKDEALIKRGFHLQERSFLREVTH